MPPHDCHHAPRRISTRLAYAAVGDAPKPVPPGTPPENDTRNPHAVAMSKLGASKGGKARAESLSAAKRKAIAKKAAAKRWAQSKPSSE
jgi:hypothetical protein